MLSPNQTPDGLVRFYNCNKIHSWSFLLPNLSHTAAFLCKKLIHVTSCFALILVIVTHISINFMAT